MKRHKNSPELSLLKFLPLTYHHSHFLAATLDFTSFFTIAFLRAAHFFTAWLFWIRLALTPKHHPALELPWAIELYYLLSLGIVVYNIYNNLQAQWDSTETNS